MFSDGPQRRRLEGTKSCKQAVLMAGQTLICISSAYLQHTLTDTHTHTDTHTCTGQNDESDSAAAVAVYHFIKMLPQK